LAEYGYRATDAEGRVSEGRLSAPGEGAARDLLREMGYVPIRLWDASARGGEGAPSPAAPALRGGKRDVVPFLLELSTFLGAGVPLDRALEMLAGLYRKGVLGEVASFLLREVRGGSSLSGAMQRAPGGVFDRFVVQMAAAGEATGSLAEALGQVHRFLQRSRDFRSHVLGSLIYPAILLAASVLSVVSLVVFVVPRFSGVFRSARVLLPLPTRLLLSASVFLRERGIYLLAAAVLAALAARAALADPATRRRWDRAKLGWPLVGDIASALETSRVTRSLASLLAGGVPILSAFLIAREVSGNAAVRDGMEAARLKVQGGAKVARALEETTPLPDTALRMIAVGEETGRLEPMLSSVADAYEEKARRGMRNLLVLLEPTVILLMGLVVGFIVFAIFLAVFRLNEVPL
jgi:general secretion pathway protein F